MLKHRQPHTDSAPSEARSEEQIRADERARVEEELQELEVERRRHADPAAGPTADDRVEQRVGDDDRLADDERPIAPVVADDRVVVDDDRDRLDRDEPVEVVRTRSFSVGQLLATLVGAALIALGVVALVRTGVDTPLSEPVEPVFGWDHTPLLGIVEIAAGALLVVFALRPGGRWLVAVVGIALIVGGGLILAEADVTVDELGAERDFGWVPIVAGALAVLAALLTPRRYQRVTGTPVTG